MTDPVREDDLHAYVDGALPEARRLDVEAWLAAHPEDAARVQAWAGQNQALHAAFDGVLNEPLPIDLVRAARRRPVRAPWRAMAAALALAASGLIGYGIGLREDQPSRYRCISPAMQRSRMRCSAPRRGTRSRWMRPTPRIW